MLRTPGQNGAAPEWASGEHIWLGNAITLNFPSGSSAASAVTFTLPNGATVTYGQIIALADYFGIPSKPISDDPTAARFQEIFDLMAVSTDAVTPIGYLKGLMITETNAIQQAITDGVDPSTLLRQDDNDMNWYYAGAIGATQFLRLLANNFDHFGDDALKAWTAGHKLAITTALAGYAESQTDPTAAAAALDMAYCINAFADHFLTDLFSAGHLRTPRRALHDDVAISALGDECSHLMHDEDCFFGLNVVSKNVATPWMAYGDTFMLDGKDNQNYQYALAATQASANDIWTAFSTGVAPTEYAALAIVPDLQQARNWRDTRNSPALFIQRHGELHARKDVTSFATRSWTSDWTPLGVIRAYDHSTLAQQSGAGEWAYPLQTDVLRLYPSTDQRHIAVQRYTGLVGGTVTKVWEHAKLASWPTATPVFVGVDFRGEGLTSIVCIDAGRSDGKLPMSQLAPSLSDDGYYVAWSRKDMRQPSTAGDGWLAVYRGTDLRQGLAQVTNVNGSIGVALWQPHADGVGLGLVTTAVTNDDPWPPLAVMATEINGQGKQNVAYVFRNTSGQYMSRELVQSEDGFSDSTTFWFTTPAVGVQLACGNVYGDGTDRLIVLKPYVSQSAAVLSVYPLTHLVNPHLTINVALTGDPLLFCFDVDGDGVDEIVVASATTVPSTFQVWKIVAGALTLIGTTTIEDGLGASEWTVANLTDAGFATLLQFWSDNGKQGLIQYRSDPTQGTGIYAVSAPADLGEVQPNQQLIPVARGAFATGD